jgi:hypothetical protein
MLADVNEQRLKEIIEKHVVRPMLPGGENVFHKNLREIEETMNVNSNFLNSFV